MSAGEIAALITAFVGVLTGAFGAYRAVSATRIESTSNVVEAYRSITDNLQEENERLVRRNLVLEEQLAKCKEGDNGLSD